VLVWQPPLLMVYCVVTCATHQLYVVGVLLLWP
jgi:hypothetical protein